MRLAWVLAGAGLLALAAGCGGHSDPPVNCPQNLPTTCPATAPSFTADVKPIFDSVCTTCHTPGGQMASVPFNTYAQIYGRRTTILSQVYDCVMPPVNGPQLS